MKITVNGSQKEVASETALETLIGQFVQDQKIIIAELNGQIVKSDFWKQQTLQEGDCLELITFVGGG